MKKKALILFMTGMLATTSLTGCGSWNGDDVALTVGKEEISADVANFYARYTQATYETYYSAYLGEDMWNSEAEKGKEGLEMLGADTNQRDFSMRSKQ